MPKKSNSTLTTTPDSLTFSANSGLTAIGIVAPHDSLYPANRLSVTVTALPADGAIFFSDGITPVHVGRTLTVAQLTSLEFMPTPGLFGTISTFAYKVTDPSGKTAPGAANLSIAPDSLPPSTTSASLTVAENTGPATIGIVSPADPNYSASQLSVRITGLPSDGTVLLSDAVTPVSLGESLTVAQLTGLKFSPLAGAFGTSSTFSYDVSNPSGLSTSGTATLAIGPDTLPPIATATSLTVAGNSAPPPSGIAPHTDP